MTNIEAAFGYADDPEGVELSQVDSLGSVPLSVVTSPGGPDTGVKPEVPFEETVVYELHVKGFTAQHPDVPEPLRGTYLGIAHPAVDRAPPAPRRHERRAAAGPVVLRRALARAGRPTQLLGLLAAGLLRTPRRATPASPAARSRSSAPWSPPCTRRTSRSSSTSSTTTPARVAPDGPTLSFRGYEAPAYYLHDEDGHMADSTGCGNTLEASSPTVIRLVTDSLRYWATELGVDGFRFDLASTLGRPSGGPFDRDSALLTAIATDPVLSRCKLIAEPWDATGEGYKVGDVRRPVGRVERHLPRHRPRLLARRSRRRRRPGLPAVRFLRPLRPHAAAAPGSRSTSSTPTTASPCATSSPTTASTTRPTARTTATAPTTTGRGTTASRARPTTPTSRRCAQRQARNLFATLMLSTGTPMLVAGDERWRTQGGNNNAYSLDDPTSWVDWTATDDADAMLAFARRVVHLRADSPALRQPEFFDGRTTPTGRPDLIWLRPDGQRAGGGRLGTDDDRQFLGMWIDGSNSQSRTREGELLPDHSWLLLMHAGAEDIDVVLPGVEFGKTFKPTLDTTNLDGAPTSTDPLAAGSSLRLGARSLLLLKAPRGD